MGLRDLPSVDSLLAESDSLRLFLQASAVLKAFLVTIRDDVQHAYSASVIAAISRP